MRKVEDFDVLCFEMRAKDWYCAIVCCGLYTKNQMEKQCFSNRIPRCSTTSD